MRSFRVLQRKQNKHRLREHEEDQVRRATESSFAQQQCAPYQLRLVESLIFLHLLQIEQDMTRPLRMHGLNCCVLLHQRYRATALSPMKVPASRSRIEYQREHLRYEQEAKMVRHQGARG